MDNDSKRDSRKFLPLAIAVIVAVAAIGFCASRIATANAVAAEVQSLTEQKEALERQTVDARAKLVSTDEEVLSSATAIDYDRKADDDAIVKDSLSEVFTWQGYGDYMTSRAVLQRSFNLEDDSQMLNNLFETWALDDSDNATAYVADEDNMRFIDMDSHVLSVVEGTYRYLTIVTVGSSDKFGNVGEGDVALEYTVDENGSVHGLFGYVIAY